MRIIGQSARTDVPYERVILKVRLEGNWKLEAYEMGDDCMTSWVLGIFRDRGAALAAHSRILADYADGKKVSRVAADNARSE